MADQLAQELAELKRLVIPQVYDLVEAKSKEDPELVGMMVRAVYMHIANKLAPADSPVGGNSDQA